MPVSLRPAPTPINPAVPATRPVRAPGPPWARLGLPPAAWLGLVGSLLIALGELQRWSSGRTNSAPAWAGSLATLLPSGLAVSTILLGMAVLTLGWVRLRPGRAAPTRWWAVVTLWSLPLLLLPPMLSTDAQAYADLGWMINHSENPYVTGLGTTGSPFDVARVWQGTTSVYPALGLQLMALVVRWTGSDAYWSVVALRLLAVLGAALLAWALPKVAEAVGADPETALWLGLANPLVVIHGVGGEHLDLLMAGLAAAAIAVATYRHGFWPALVVVGLAAAVKQPALLAALPVAALAASARTQRWPAFLVRTGVAVGGSGLAFVLVSLATGLGLGWVHGTGDPSAVPTVAPAAVVATLLTQLATFAGLSVPTSLAALLVVAGQVLALSVVAGAFVLYGKDKPLRFLAVAAFCWVLGFGAFREWYLLLPVAFVGLARLGRGLAWLTSVLIPVGLVYGCFREYSGWQPMAALTAALALAVLANAAGALVRPGRTPAPQPA